MDHTKESEKYEEYLWQRELAESTRKLYGKQAERFLDFLKERKITKTEVIAYKGLLQKKYQKLSTVNLYLTALNSYLRYAGYENCIVKIPRRQRRQRPDNILSVSEYREMLAWARKSGREKYYCIMRTLALTGIRISELSGCTMEALKQGRFTICNKGKSREVYLPEKLVAELREYCSGQGIREGTVFLGSTGNPISRVAVYKMLTQMAEYIGIPKKKAHPHSFRHLFAVTYMQQYSNMFELADMLGHTSLETTRIYTVTTAEEKRKKMNGLKL